MSDCRCNTLVRLEGPIHGEHDYRCAGDLRAELEKLRDDITQTTYASYVTLPYNVIVERIDAILAKRGCGRQFTAKEFAIGVQYGKPEEQ